MIVILTLVTIIILTIRKKKWIKQIVEREEREVYQTFNACLDPLLTLSSCKMFDQRCGRMLRRNGASEKVKYYWIRECELIWRGTWLRNLARTVSQTNSGFAVFPLGAAYEMSETRKRLGEINIKYRVISLRDCCNCSSALCKLCTKHQ